MGLREKLRQWCPNPENSFFARVKRHSKPVLITTTALFAIAVLVSSILLLQQQAVATFPKPQPIVPSPTPSPSATSTPAPTAPTPTATPTPSSSPTATPAPTLGGYEKSIIINTDNIEEENALSVADNFNYSSLLQVEQFYSVGGSDYYNYTWANFIDKEVINYYNDRFESLKGQPKNMTFNYTANVYAWNQTGVVYDPGTYLIHVISSNGTVLFKSAKYTGPNFGMRYFCKNDSGYQEIQTGQINFNFSTTYVVEMKLKYSETYNPLAGYMSDVYQIIIVDEHFEPLFLCFQAQKLVS